MTGLNDFQVFTGTENKLTNQKYMDEVLELCIDPHAAGPVKATLSSVPAEQSSELRVWTLTESKGEVLRSLIEEDGKKCFCYTKLWLFF